MAFICILCGGLQVMMLLSITGVLISLAALSKLMEIIIILISPLFIFMLRQCLKLILLLNILSLQRISNVLREMCSIRPFDMKDLPERTDEIMIGIVPVRVPYSKNNFEAEIGQTISQYLDQALGNIVGDAGNKVFKIMENPDVSEPGKSSTIGKIDVELSRAPSEGFDVDSDSAEGTKKEEEIEEILERYLQSDDSSSTVHIEKSIHPSQSKKPKRRIESPAN